MEMNRNHFLLIGLVVLFLGIQLRLVEDFVLNEPTSKFLAERMNKQPAVVQATMPNPMFSSPTPPIPLRTIKPPKFVGWILVSVGGVLVLHSLAMKKPGG
jgi:hypothetical protein